MTHSAPSMGLPKLGSYKTSSRPAAYAEGCESPSFSRPTPVSLAWEILNVDTDHPCTAIMICPFMDHVIVLGNHSVQTQGSWNAISNVPALVACIGRDKNGVVLDASSSSAPRKESKPQDAVQHDFAADLVRSVDDRGTYRECLIDPCHYAI